MLSSHTVFILSFPFLRAVVAQQFINFTAIDPNQCAAPSAYLSCYEGVVQNTAKCMNETEGNPTAQKGCGCVDGEEKINCFAGACWNRIYGCEYQNQVGIYLAECSLPASDIPFWPSPSNVPGACSCNTGLILETIYGTENSLFSFYDTAIGNLQKLYECECCGLAVGVSTFFDICPATDPTLLGLNTVLSLGTKRQYDVPWPSCGQYIQNIVCVADLGFVAPLTTGTVFNPTNTPAAGTQTLFDEPGTVTSPPSGSVFTWFAYQSSYSYVVTAIEAEEPVATGGVGITATGGGVTKTGVAGAASTSSGSGSSGGTTKSSAGNSLPLRFSARLALVMVLGFSICL